MTLLQELRQRGMVHDTTPGTEEQLQKEMTSAYIGFDPTADSLHIGSLVQIMLLMHFQRAGHKPYPLVGGATGMIGDPSGKSEERKLLDTDTLRHNQEGIRKQLERFLDFDCGPNSAVMVNNYDWMKDFSFLDFLRVVGKHLTVNYMMAKDSVKKRLEGGTGMSFTEFTYQLVQGYDFVHLFENHNCKLQMGGSDQWGNITTGTELIRRKTGGEAFGLTCPLLTRADGGKFGKTEQGNVWLDAKLTSPYRFYQFWLNCADADAERYIKIFSILDIPSIEKIIEDNRQQPHLRELQKVLAAEVTTRVHSEADTKQAIEASGILFGQGTEEQLRSLSNDMFLAVFEGVPQFTIPRAEFMETTDITDLLSVKTAVFASKAEARRSLKENAVAINKENNRRV
jgi:tyrosyl-tRNA synthetase